MAKELRKRMAAKTDKLEVFNKEKKNNQTDEEYNNWNEKYSKINQ